MSPDPDDRCVCTHERDLHDFLGCSVRRCRCPHFSEATR